MKKIVFLSLAIIMIIGSCTQQRCTKILLGETIIKEPLGLTFNNIQPGSNSKAVISTTIRNNSKVPIILEGIAVAVGEMPKENDLLIPLVVREKEEESGETASVQYGENGWVYTTSPKGDLGVTIDPDANYLIDLPFFSDGSQECFLINISIKDGQLLEFGPIQINLPTNGK